MEKSIDERNKAYKLAEKYAFKHKTDEMLEEFEMAKLVLTVYYRMHDQEMEAEKLEKEYEDIKRQTLDENAP